MYLPRTDRKSASSAVGSLRLLVGLGLLVAVLLPIILQAAAPGWWTSSGVLTPGAQANDFAAVNQGQVKMIATQAAAELDAYLPGGAGDAVHALVNSWATPTAQSNDFAPANLGMLKTVAKPFYDRLISVGYTGAYPWIGPSVPPANDYAAANIGQVKNLFSFDLQAVTSANDINGDGLPDSPGGMNSLKSRDPWLFVNDPATKGMRFCQPIRAP